VRVRLIMSRSASEGGRSGGASRSGGRRQSAKEANASKYNRQAEDVVRTVKPVDFTRGDHPTIYMIAPPKSGKTTAMYSIMRDFAGLGPRKAPQCAYVVCGSEDVRHDLAKVVPSSLIHASYNENILLRVCENADSIWKDYRSNRPQMMILDDVAHEFDDILKSKAMQMLHFNHRHVGITTLITSQYVKKIPKGCRSNMDYLLVFGSCTGSFIDGLFDEYFKGVFENKHVFKRVFRAITSRNAGKTALVMNMRAASASGQVLGSYTPDYSCNPEPRCAEKENLDAPRFRPWRLCSRMAWMADELARTARARKEAQSGGATDATSHTTQKLRERGKALAPARRDDFEAY
jgi:hypothetical protein